MSDWRPYYECDVCSSDTPGCCCDDASRLAQLTAERDSLASSLDLCRDDRKSMGAKIGALTEERDQLRRDYLDVADTIAKESTGPADLVKAVRTMRTEIDRLRSLVRRVGDHGPTYERQRELIESLRAALRRYGVHDAKFIRVASGDCADWDDKPCTCGLDAALAAEGDRSGEP